jgi:hypothetical protein
MPRPRSAARRIRSSPARPIADWGRRFGRRYLPRLTEDLRRLPLEGIVPQPPRHGSWYSIRSHSDSHTHSHTWSGTCRRKSSCRYIYRLAIIDAYLIGEVPRAYRCFNGIVAACWRSVGETPLITTESTPSRPRRTAVMVTESPVGMLSRSVIVNQARLSASRGFVATGKSVGRRR